MTIPERTGSERGAELVNLCELCGKSVEQEWWAELDVWRGLCDGHNMLCVPCFDNLAAKKGIILFWQVKVSKHSKEAWQQEQIARPASHNVVIPSGGTDVQENIQSSVPTVLETLQSSKKALTPASPDARDLTRQSEFYKWWDSEGNHIAIENGKFHAANMAWKAGEQAGLELAAQHTPTWIPGDSPIEEYAICSCGQAKADGATPYEKIWREHIRALLPDPKSLERERALARLSEHHRGCTLRGRGSCSRCIELGDEAEIKLANQRIAELKLAASQGGAGDVGANRA